MTFSQPEKDVNSLGSIYMHKLVFYKDKDPGGKKTKNPLRLARALWPTRRFSQITPFL